MTVREQVLRALEAHRGEVVSGGALSADLGVSRQAVWKAITALRADGLEIDSVAGEGYRLRADDAAHRFVSLEGEIPFENYIKIDNTNLSPREAAEMIRVRFGF